jgi:trehalose 6-phosphate phosphatase
MTRRAVTDLPPPPLDLLQDATLFLDFDGTLVDLAPTPDGAIVDTALAALMLRLAARLDGRVAIVSGRSVESVRTLFGDAGFAISGSPGLEIAWPDGRHQQVERPAALDRIVTRMKAFATAQTGVLVEEKPLGAALHYRTVPEAETASHDLARALADDAGLHLQTGKMMVEVRVPGADKGTAIAAMMTQAELAGRTPVFLGDDDTDEPAMVVVAAHRGAGILVGAPRPTAATYRLPSVAATRAWLMEASA